MPNQHNVRILEKTQQEWRYYDSGLTRVYNRPESTGQMLDDDQGKVPGFEGTCGIVSCVNVLRLAGRTETTEEEILTHAIYTNQCLFDSTSSYENGATLCGERQQILEDFGLKSFREAASVDAIARYVSEGRGVIISVYSRKLWKDPRQYNTRHAITVTSVKKDQSGNILGFYVCDSGSKNHDNARYYEADFLSSALTSTDMNVTKAIIR